MATWCLLIRKPCLYATKCDPPYDCIMVEAHIARDNVSDWKRYYLWFPRKFDGRWHWRITMFRRKVWNEYDSWYEYSFLPMPGLPIYPPLEVN